MARKLIVVNPDASPEEMMRALEEALEELREEGGKASRAGTDKYTSGDEEVE